MYKRQVLGSPVYYASASGQVCAFADRLFYAGGRRFAGKLGASVVSCRRGGASAAFDRLNKYCTIANMPVVPSQYWNQVHGRTPEELSLIHIFLSQQIQKVFRTHPSPQSLRHIGGFPKIQKPDARLCSIPVSYTHLDVYKRQVQIRSILLSGTKSK